MVRVLEYALFAILVAANLSLGLYFSFRRTNVGAGSRGTAEEVFLAGRTLKTIPLAASSVASLFSSTGLVGFPAHFYAYGWHLSWGYLTPLVLIPLATHVFVPVLYRLGITSIFEYIRLRFNGNISLTACVIYLFLTQTVGAISIFAASLTLVTAFKAPLFWCNVFIGLTGTLYTALGGLRGVVWMDCMQLFFILFAPITVVSKIIIDSLSANSTVPALTSADLKKYMGNYSFDLTNDETIWACFFGSCALATYRICLDQVVAQRLMACRTLGQARRTACTSTALLFVVYLTGLFLGMALTVWFRGCDPALTGAIQSIDQILPHYINTNLIHVPGFTGLFLAGIVSAGTSTVSSTINSQAAILYVDVIVPRFKNAEHHVLRITRGTALLLGVLMTVYSTICVHMGSLTRIFMMVYNSITAAFVGLCLLALLFPFVHSKGAGVATLVVVAYQLAHITDTIRNGRKPPRMETTLEYCPVNASTIQQKIFALFFSDYSSEGPLAIFHLSHMWASFFSIFACVLIGVIVSALTGGIVIPDLCRCTVGLIVVCGIVVVSSPWSHPTSGGGSL
ncbi:sodium-coupled monocarboxylate transporter 1-like [Amblyomma americanum]